jgi:predicted acylesterase/phospholipase RssA/CRP-like cAMP-binding protein
VFLVRSGECAVSIETLGGMVEVGVCTTGELIGEVAALSGMTRSASLTALGDVEVIAVTPSEFETWLAARPEESQRVSERARVRLLAVQTGRIVIELFGAQSAGLVPAMLAAAEWVDVAAGQQLFAEGDRPDAVYLVLAGRLQASKSGVAGERSVLGEIGRAEIVGEVAVIQQSPRTATVIALRDSTLARFSIDVFEQLLIDHPPLMLNVVRRIVARSTAHLTEPRSSCRSVAVVMTADLDSLQVGHSIADALRPFGSCGVLSSDSIDLELARPTIAQSRQTDLGDVRLSQFLNEFEAGHDFVVFVTDADQSAWTRRAIQRADVVLVFCPANPTKTDLESVERSLEVSADTLVQRWLILVEPATATRGTPVDPRLPREQFSQVHHLRPGRASDLERLARLSGGVGYGLVLGGGGARGFAHVGVIRALRELGVPIDRLGGSSMGSIFAAGAALYEDHDELVAACANQFDRLLDYTVPIVSLLKAKRITTNLTKSLGGYDIEDLWIPLYCVSTNLTKSRSEVHRRGDLVAAVRASIAIPGLLPPVPMGDDLLVDGGVLNNVPADIMRSDPSIGTVIAIDVAPQHGPRTSENYGMYVSGWRALRKFVQGGRGSGQSADSSYPGVGSVLVRTMITGSERRRRAMKADGTADLYLELEMDGIGLLEFDRMNHVMQRGYDAARPQIVQWLADRHRADS